MSLTTSEIQPRVPVDNNVHRIDISNGTYEVVTVTGDAPSARVGHTAASIGSDIYVFGGVSRSIDRHQVNDKLIKSVAAKK